MPTNSKFEEIEAWKTARELTRMIYALTEQRQYVKDFGLKNQIQRASVSVMSNIAEGFESRAQGQFIEYLGRSKASAGVVHCQLYIAIDLNNLTEEQFKQTFDLADKSSRQISRFISYFETNNQARRICEERAEYEI